MSSLTSSVSATTFNGSITFVPRITVSFPTLIDVVRYFRQNANLANETERDLETEMNWDNTQTWTIPILNDFCILKLVKALPGMYQDEVRGLTKVLKVEIFDPQTHKLIAASDMA